MALAGEDCKSSARGMFLVKTNSEYPFAKGWKTFSVNDAQPRNLNDEWRTSKVVLENNWRDLNDVDMSRSLWLLKDIRKSNTTENNGRRSQPAPAN